MKRIRQLPPEVVTKIAAGEVIERPASVVKELLENSVDAGSTRIDMDIEQGGTELIRVVDNGHGIMPDDMPLVFASHATSKLSSADDLFRIGTLGFRGEALASVSGVAQVTLQSRPPDQPCGAEVGCNGGELASPRTWNGAPGTRIEVRHLFYNTPVRRKFLRTTGTEMGHITEVFTRLALANPRLHMTLRHNGKLVHEVTGGPDIVPAVGLLDRIGIFFGSEVRDQLYLIEAEQKPCTLRGYIADPACERGNARMQYLFLNGRWIRDRSLGHALQEGYRGLLMTGRYSVAFLFLEVPPELVDVNVHPTKAEVRFRDAQSIYHLVFGSIRNRLRAEDLTARLHSPSPLSGSRSQAGQAAHAGTSESAPWSLSAPLRRRQGCRSVLHLPSPKRSIHHCRRQRHHCKMQTPTRPNQIRLRWSRWKRPAMKDCRPRSSSCTMPIWSWKHRRACSSSTSTPCTSASSSSSCRSAFAPVPW